jgi:hypothetical protein
MKKIISKIILFLICIISAYSQSIEPTPFLFNYYVNNVLYSNQALNPDLFKQTTFLTGMQWGQSAAMSKAIKLNASANALIGNDTNYAGINPINLVIQPGADPTKATDLPALFSAAMLDYRPYLQITDISKFKTIVGDPDDPVIGFKNIDSRTTVKKSSDGRSRLYMDTTNFTKNNRTLILSEPCPDDQLITFHGDNQYSYYEGDDWFIKINLRRLENINTNDDDTVLVALHQI